MRDVLEPPGILRKITATDGQPKQPAQGHLRAGTRAADVWDRHGNALPQEGPLRAGDPAARLEPGRLRGSAAREEPPGPARPCCLLYGPCSVLPLGRPPELGTGSIPRGPGSRSQSWCAPEVTGSARKRTRHKILSPLVSRPPFIPRTHAFVMQK